MYFIKILIMSAVVFSILPISPGISEDSAYSQVDGNPFVKNKPVTDFKLPSTPNSNDGKFKGFDYDKSTQLYDKLNIKNKTRPYSPYQKSQAFGGSEIEYNREFGSRDAMERIKEIEADLNNNDKKE